MFSKLDKILLGNQFVGLEIFTENGEDGFAMVCVEKKKNELFIAHKEKQNNISERLQFNEFKYDYFEKRITLPENLDIEFVAANYESGVIRIYIPKTARPVKNVHQIIVVY